jgi:hypothetical protein
MTLVNHAEFPLGYIDKVHVHILRTKKQHVFILAQFHRGNVFTRETTQIVFLHKYTVVSAPNA